MRDFWTPACELELHLEEARSNLDPPHALHEYFLERQRKLPFDLAYTEARFGDVRSWREQAVGHLKDALVLPERAVSMNTRVLSRSEHSEYFREEVEFEALPGVPVPATVLVPRGDPPFPALLALHDMGAMRTFGREKLLSLEGEPSYLRVHKNENYSGRNLADELAMRGYLVIAIDALIFGERCVAQEERERFRRERLSWSEEYAARHASNIAFHVERGAFANAVLCGDNWAGMVVTEDIATLDYLCSRDDVDSARLGCIGLSFGAYRANYLAALDERIRVAVSVCWMATLDSVIGYNTAGAMGFFTLLPQLYPHLDICDIASLACPRAFLAISGWQDILMQPYGIAKAHQKLREVWKKARISENLGSLCFDAPHEFNAAMQDCSFDFLDEHLKT
jgi:dienelactone hydrolase